MKKLLVCCVFICAFTDIYCTNISCIHSDSTEYQNDTIYCKGNVIFVYNGKVISADSIKFDEKNDIIEAIGNVIIKDEFSNAYFMDRVIVKQNFKFGTAINLKIITEDKTRLAARKSEIIDGKYRLEDVIVTPCYECTESGLLTWQLKSKFVDFDPETYTIYEDATLESFGVPVFYTPHLSHVSSNIKRRSGFLVPKFSISSQRGACLLPQYLFSISDSQELILKPILTTKIGQVGWMYYGWRFLHGEFNIDASLTGTKSVHKRTSSSSEDDRRIDKINRSGYRGHIFSSLKYEIDNHWRTGIDLNLVSDMYYLKRFPFFENPDRTLESSAYIEGFDERNYTRLKSSMFQGEDLEFAPKILPMAEHNHFFKLFNGTFSLDMMFVNLDFHKGRNSQKYILNPSWTKELLLSGGHIISLNSVVSLQGLKVSEVSKSGYDSYFQVLPQLNLTWQWPLVVDSILSKMIFTPITGVSIAGSKKNFDSFESPFDEINEANLFSNNKSISSYNVDPGCRYFYGIKIDGYCTTRNIYRLVLGQSIEMTQPEKRPKSSGMKYKHSDIVGALDIFPNQNLTFSSSAIYSQRSHSFDKIDVGINYQKEEIGFGIMGFKGKQCFYNPFTARQALDETTGLTEKRYKGAAFNANYKINYKLKADYEIVFGNSYDIIKSLDQNKDGQFKLLKQGVGINFENECAKFSFRCERLNRKYGDLHPETNFKFIVHLKKLG